MSNLPQRARWRYRAPASAARALCPGNANGSDCLEEDSALHRLAEQSTRFNC